MKFLAHRETSATFSIRAAARGAHVHSLYLAGSQLVLLVGRACRAPAEVFEERLDLQNLGGRADVDRDARRNTRKI